MKRETTRGLSGVIGLWGIGFFSPDLQQYVAEPQYKQEAVEQGYATAQQAEQNQLPPEAEDTPIQAA